MKTACLAGQGECSSIRSLLRGWQHGSIPAPRSDEPATPAPETVINGREEAQAAAGSQDPAGDDRAGRSAFRPAAGRVGTLARRAAPWRILARVRAGSVYWNCCDRVSPRLPWSGVGDSGVGLTLSKYGISRRSRG